MFCCIPYTYFFILWKYFENMMTYAYNSGRKYLPEALYRCNNEDWHIEQLYHRLHQFLGSGTLDFLCMLGYLK